MNTSRDIPAEKILFQNEACLVINKQPGEDSEFFLPVHRLDTPVSGCLLLAKTRDAAAFLGAAFARPEGSGETIQKHYWAITEMPTDEFREELHKGNRDSIPAEGELVHWLYENKKLNKAFAVPWNEGKAPHKGGYAPPKKAVLRYRVIGQGERYLFLQIELVTGRHHQIRAQLAAIGLRVKGDLKYGARRSEKSGCIRLHAFSLAFPNPLNHEEKIEVKAAPPLDDSLWRAFAESAGLAK